VFGWLLPVGRLWPMPALGHERHLERAATTSGLPR
jgi:hypothetical protein